jgi:hypothetical protein
MRESTLDFSIGFDLLRWGDSIEQIGSLYPVHGKSSPRTGRNPETGEVIRIGPGVAIRPGHFRAPVDTDGIELWLHARVGPDGGTDTISLSSGDGDDRYSGSTAEQWTGAIVALVQRLSRVFGFGPVDPEIIDQSWQLPEVTVELLLESGEFSLTFEHHGSSDG